MIALDTRRLDELEDKIERGLQTFVEVGDALSEIRDARLYRESHDTFEDYCRERWGFNRNYANKQIAAAEVVRALGTNVPTPANEGQARELAPLKDEPEAMTEAWQEAQVIATTKARPVTASDVREAVTNKMAVHYSSATDEWATPQDFFDGLDAEFGFDLDVCALDSSAKCDRYFTPETDGLAQEWTGTCWMNPPYGGEIVDWVAKARESAESGATVVCLVPARVDTGWWWDHCRFGEIRFLRGRLKFGDSDTSAPFPSAVVVFGREPKVVWWDR